MNEGKGTTLLLRLAAFCLLALAAAGASSVIAVSYHLTVVTLSAVQLWGILLISGLLALWGLAFLVAAGRQ